MTKTDIAFNKLRVLAKVLETKLELNQDPKDIVGYIKQSLANYGDPFAEGIEEFMEKQATETKNPDDVAEDKLENEGSENPGIKEEAPQEKLEEKLETKTGDDIETDKKKLEEKSEDNIEGKGTEDAAPKKEEVKSSTTMELLSRASKVAAELMGKGSIELAKKVMAASGLDIINTLQELLKNEFKQHDLYQAYSYMLFGSVGIAVQEHLKEHMADELDHASILQRYITGMGAQPTLDRHPIPEVSPVSFKTILEKDLELEKNAVDNYTKAIQSLEGLTEFTSLRVDLENILTVEQEHAHDIDRWLKEYQPEPAKVSDGALPTTSAMLICDHCLNPIAQGAEVKVKDKNYHPGCAKHADLK